MSKTALQEAYKSLLSKGRLTPNPSQKALVDRLSVLQESLTTSRSPPNGLYIYGSVGTGKSRIADLFGSTLIPDVSTRRTHFHEFMTDIHMRLHRARSSAGYSGDPLLQIGREVRAESRVLFFDEFQVSDIVDAMILQRLFGSIWEAGGVMVATSNRHPSMLYENGLNRDLFVPFVGQLQRHCEVWKMEGSQDYRMVGANTTATFFTDAAKFDAAIRQTTGNRSFEKREFSVAMGRTLSVRSCQPEEGSNSVVEATFKELFTADRGSTDFHALCKNAGTIFISSLRQFRANEFDYARRFITLIDIAYERRTQVICQSAVPLAALFEEFVPKQDTDAIKASVTEGMNVKKGGGSSSSMMSTFVGNVEWSATGLAKASLATGGAGESDVRFAIGRAVSRLHEMGSKNYGQKDDAG